MYFNMSKKFLGPIPSQKKPNSVIDGIHPTFTIKVNIFNLYFTPLVIRRKMEKVADIVRMGCGGKA